MKIDTTGMGNAMNIFSGAAEKMISGLATPNMVAVCNNCASGVAAAEMPQNITSDRNFPTLPGQAGVIHS